MRQLLQQFDTVIPCQQIVTCLINANYSTVLKLNFLVSVPGTRKQSRCIRYSRERIVLCNDSDSFV